LIFSLFFAFAFSFPFSAGNNSLQREDLNTINNDGEISDSRLGILSIFDDNVLNSI